MARERYLSPQEHRDNATEFYKLVLGWQRGRGHRGKAARQAAIGLPTATAANAVPEHVRRFIAAAMADGTPMDDLAMLTAELERRLRGKRIR